MTKFKPKDSISQAEVRRQLHYDEKTGFFYWRVTKPNIKIGTKAGSLSKEGYIRITIAGRRFMGHTLAWLWMTGELKVRGIDHKDTIRSNNRWNNLRRATLSQNNMNANLRSDNTTGFKGVGLKKDKDSNRFYAAISIAGKRTHIGYFHTAEEAAAAYRRKALEHFGEFARTPNVETP